MWRYHLLWSTGVSVPLLYQGLDICLSTNTEVNVLGYFILVHKHRNRSNKVHCLGAQVWKKLLTGGIRADPHPNLSVSCDVTGSDMFTRGKNCPPLQENENMLGTYSHEKPKLFSQIGVIMPPGTHNLSSIYLMGVVEIK